MKRRNEFSYLVALAACGLVPACSSMTPASSPAPAGGAAQEWVSVAKADAHEAFVDPASLMSNGGMVEVRAKENFSTPQQTAKKDKTYLSSQSTYRVDCAAHKVAYKDIQAYPEPDLQGKAVQKATFYEKNLQWMDAPAGTVFGELLEYACEHAPAAAPAASTG
jgi:hypothetical protein